MTEALKNLEETGDGKLAAAMAAAQAKFQTVGRDREVEVATKDRGSYDFSYATLAAMVEMAKPILAEHGLAVLQYPYTRIDRHQGEPHATLLQETWFAGVETELLHSSGQRRYSRLELPVAKKDAQGIGSIISYAKRYSYGAMLGLVTADEDDDGNAGTGNEATARPTSAAVAKLKEEAAKKAAAALGQKPTPPSTPRPPPTPGKGGATGIPVVGHGKNANKPLADLNDAELAWYIADAEKKTHDEKLSPEDKATWAKRVVAYSIEQQGRKEAKP